MVGILQTFSNSPFVKDIQTLSAWFSVENQPEGIFGDLLATSDIEAALIFGWHQIFVPKELALWKGVAWCFEEMGLKQVFLLE